MEIKDFKALGKGEASTPAADKLVAGNPRQQLWNVLSSGDSRFHVGEWASGVAAPATLLPVSDLLGDRRKWKPFLKANRDKEIILYCASGIRSGNAAIHLKREGFNATNMGSLRRWSGAGLPTRKP